MAIARDIEVFLGNGDGSFRAPISTAYSTSIGSVMNISGGSVTDIHMADLNGDHIPDLVVAGYGGLETLVGAGNGTFSSASIKTYSGSSSVALVVGDINGDGNVDVILALNSLPSSAEVLLGDGNGGLGNSMGSYDVGGSAEDLYLADFNGDGILDLLAIDGSEIDSCICGAAVSVLAGNGDGSFQPRQQVLASKGLIEDGTETDMNRDGIPDIVVVATSSAYGDSVNVVLGGSGATPTPTPTPTNPNPIVPPAAGGGGTVNPSALMLLAIYVVARRRYHVGESDLTP